MSTMPPSRSATHPSMLPPTLPHAGRARGVVFLHAVPRALCPHVEWALSSIVDAEIRLDWQPQQVSPPLLRAELPWAGRPGLGSRFMSALKAIPDLVAEVTEDPSPGREGERYALTPTLGLLQDRGQRVALLTDGRMSGASGKVLAAIHLVPEAVAGGAIAKLRDGDVITIDAETSTVEVDVPEAEWAARASAPMDLAGNQFGVGRELFAVFRECVDSAEDGACALFGSTGL